ncbi:phosphoserine aminotransferase [Marivirga lumbricoides]|uniref:phosphoserine transaminase n=1 Tax=Marivirga lumbricoides TaxID=1046115 RepID=A0A2T4DVP7_9BACT|nr:phosphoserine aminotransferase [Marivirga lumbricoides]
MVICKQNIMSNFYPGPSQLYPEIGAYLQEAFVSGILEMNHRSEAFMKLDAETKELLHNRLNIPANYQIVFTSSATECWEIISQSFIEKSSLHFYNGAFGEKWFQYAKKIHSETQGLQFSEEGIPDIKDISGQQELLAFTHNETSNGTALPFAFQQDVRKQFPHQLIAYDATSSMAGYALKWELGDIWYASVQKCFGLPPGMAIMVVSPEAVARARELKDERYYNSFNYMLANAEKHQTHHTPNITNIFLLNRVLKKRQNIQEIHNQLTGRKQSFYQMIDHFPQLKGHISESKFQSDTVFCIDVTPELLNDLKSAAYKEGIIMGSGYGALKQSTFRIANFPAIQQDDFNRLGNFLNQFFK